MHVPMTLARLAALTTSALVVASAQAMPMTYTFSGLGSGQLVSLDYTTTRTFDGGAFTFTMLGDTDLIAPVPDGGVALDPLSASSVSIAGLGNLDITIHNRLGENASSAVPAPAIFFSLAGSQSQDFFDFSIPAAVDLSRAFGPVTSTSTFVAQFVDIPTTLGYLTFTASSNVVFQAHASAVPEPASAILLGVGLGALGLAATTRRTRRGRDGRVAE